MEKNNSQKNFSSILNEAIKAKGMDEAKLANETGISERFIRLLIQGDFSKLPASPYLHGYILKIADVLDMDGEKIWEAYFKNSHEIKTSGKLDNLPKNRFSVSKINKKALIFPIIILAVIIYFVFNTILSFDISRELKLQGFNEDPFVWEESSYEIVGEINPSYKLNINQQPVNIKSDGSFSKNVELNPGFNTIIFEIKGLLKKGKEIAKEIYYETEDNENSDTTSATSTEDETTTTSTIINN